MTRRRLPIGLQTFRELREEDCYYVDKTERDRIRGGAGLSRSPPDVQGAGLISPHTLRLKTPEAAFPPDVQSAGLISPDCRPERLRTRILFVAHLAGRRAREDAAGRVRARTAAATRDQ